MTIFLLIIGCLLLGFGIGGIFAITNPLNTPITKTFDMGDNSTLFVDCYSNQWHHTNPCDYKIYKNGKFLP